MSRSPAATRQPRQRTSISECGAAAQPPARLSDDRGDAQRASHRPASVLRAVELLAEPDRRLLQRRVLGRVPDAAGDRGRDVEDRLSRRHTADRVLRRGVLRVRRHVGVFLEPRDHARHPAREPSAHASTPVAASDMDTRCGDSGEHGDHLGGRHHPPAPGRSAGVPCRTACATVRPHPRRDHRGRVFQHDGCRGEHGHPQSGVLPVRW